MSSSSETLVCPQVLNSYVLPIMIHSIVKRYGPYLRLLCIIDIVDETSSKHSTFLL